MVCSSNVSLGWRLRVLAVATFVYGAHSVAAPLDQGSSENRYAPSPLHTLVSDEPSRQQPDAIIFALMSGKCTTFKIAGRDLKCRAVAFFQTEDGRANYTVAVKDPADDSHTITFSGDNGRRDGDRYELPIDRIQFKSKDRPKADGLPVPLIEPSVGICRQEGSFVTKQMSNIHCTATVLGGKTFELGFQSDGAPMDIKRIKRTRVGPAPASPFDDK